MKHILVIGSLNMDLVVKVEKLPKLGETILGETLYENPGGKGANQAVAAAKLGGNVSMIGKLGKDNYGEQLLLNLKSNNIKTEGIIRCDDITGTAVIEVDSKGNNSIVVIPGSNLKLSKEDLDSASDLIDKADIVILQQEIPMETVEYALELAAEKGKITILNPAPAVKISEKVLAATDFLILNETELEIISGKESIPETEYIYTINELRNKGAKNIILTLGEKGGMYTEGEEIKEYKALKVTAVDTTAAGDSFIGAFALKLAENAGVSDALEFAVGVSALTVTRSGAQQSLPTQEELKLFLESK
ncbi:Ribokinase [Sebaldella termitidis]|uniref:Ribokinase n=1 Tax=Sebaldella termitidis (strain ATCC 33386 / NCTC 11300) TaxID=526218 RepID=D1ARH9_SEBTE|nr:ribokinase [Sebaldella termitidis]ACZ10465.1 ribokinase [Sebaldella termitidis ATCC 33386]SUI25807.1 Ribokinase [Sebaldella termitidis]